MSVSAKEILVLLRGEAPLELQSRFLEESSRPESDLTQMLNAAETWAHVKLNRRCPSPPAPLVDQAAEVTVLRKAAFWDDQAEGEASAVGVKELLEYLRGTAPATTAAALKAAMADPTSELSRLLGEMEREGNNAGRSSAPGPIDNPPREM